MKNTTLKAKFLSLVIMLTMLVGMVPLSGIMSFAVENTATCEHTDEDDNKICDACESFISESIESITLGENVTVDIPYGREYHYLKFTPETSGLYRIESYQNDDSYDPMLFVYNENGEELNSDDDYGVKLQFCLELELTADVTYYLGIYDRIDNKVCTFAVKNSCNEHTASEIENCLGILCSVCENYYGDGNYRHDATDVIDCRGVLCSLCYEYFGEGTDDHVLEGPEDCRGTMCTVCSNYFGDASDDHFDADGNGDCDKCDVLLPESIESLTLGENVVVDFTYAYAYRYFRLVPEVSGTYYFESYKTEDSLDPYLYIYSENREQLYANDDGGENLQFYLEADLTAGVVYYIGIQERAYDKTCTFYVNMICDEHIASDVVDCRGTLCSVCGKYFGEVDVYHIASDVVDCRGTICSVCKEYYGEGTNDHTPSDTMDCRGIFCYTCNEYYGESGYDHEDGNGDHICDFCSDILTGFAVNVGSNFIPLEASWYVYYKFIPDVSGKYIFTSYSEYDPKLSIYDDRFELIDNSDDVEGMNFSLEISLIAGKTYYLEFYEYIESNECLVKISKTCDEHIPAGAKTCLGTLCSVCGRYYGDMDPTLHVLNNFEYNYDGHFNECSVCEKWVYLDHEYDENGRCICGYIEHDHVYDIYIHSSQDHWLACSICRLMLPDSLYEEHNYNEEGVCAVCDRQILTGGIYVGNTFLTDGNYLDNQGNVSSTAPTGGYAYYNDGVLTLNNFVVTMDGANAVGEISSILAESDLYIILVGDNYIKTSGGDGISVAYANLTIDGNGCISIITELKNGYVGDGIDVDYGNLTVNGGKFIIDASDHGIEVDGDTEINDGIFYINARDDGMDLNDVVINGGIFYIDVEDNGIDADHGMVINGGDFHIITNEEIGLETSENLTINDGNFYISTDDECIFVGGILTISGGRFEFNSREDDAAIVAAENIIFGENMGDQNVQYSNDYDCYVWFDEDDAWISSSNLSPIDDEEKTIIKDWIDVSNNSVYNGEEQRPVISVYDYNSDKELVLGVDYRVDTILESMKNPGSYPMVVTGIGDYTGSIVVDFIIHEGYEITLDEKIEVAISGLDDRVYTYVKFTPNVSATYRFIFNTSNILMVDYYDGEFNAIDFFTSDDGYLCVDLELVAGVTYYFDVYDYYNENILCEISVELNCVNHRGGTATYHDKAVCEICGEEYGDVLECPGHHGGEATYHDHAVCEECGFEYGDLLVCNHMCHKGGLYSIIWGMIDEIYDLFGIPNTCACGDEH